MSLSHCRLGVNVDHVATLRQARKAKYPDPVAAAAFAELGGAEQITIHLREDKRHIQPRDLELLRQTVKSQLNLEMAGTQEMVKTAYEIRPDIATLVPERREELTTEGGLDAAGGKDALGKVVKTLRDAEIEVSLFIDADLDQVKAAHRISAQRIELNTGRYCEAPDAMTRGRELARLVDAAKTGKRLGLLVAAGHGLHYDNVRPVAGIAEIEELNIGHAIVARAVLTGMERATRDMVELIRLARR